MRAFTSSVTRGCTNLARGVWVRAVPENLTASREILTMRVAILSNGRPEILTVSAAQGTALVPPWCIFYIHHYWEGGLREGSSNGVAARVSRMARLKTLECHTLFTCAVSAEYLRQSKQLYKKINKDCIQISGCFREETHWIASTKLELSRKPLSPWIPYYVMLRNQETLCAREDSIQRTSQNET